MSSNAQKSLFFAGGAILFWSTVASAFKIALKHVDYITLLLVSSYVSLFTYGILILLQKKIKLLRSQQKKDLFRSMLYGGLNPFLYYLFIFKSYSLLPAQIAQPLNFTWPLVLVLFSMLFFKEKVRWQIFIALFISFVGIIFISSEGRWFTFNFKEPLGITLALSSSIIWAGYWLLNRNDKRDAIIKLFFNFLFASLYISFVFVLTHELYLPTVKGILASAYIGLFEMGITFVLWMKALEYAKNTQFLGNLIYLTPFLSLLLIHFVLKEQIYYSSVTGLGLIILGIIIQGEIRKSHD